MSKNDCASLKSVTSASCSKQTSVLVFHSSRVSVFVCEKHLAGLSASASQSPLCSLSELESWESLMEEFRGPEITHLITPPTPKKTRLEKKKADSKRRKRKRCLFSSVGSCWTNWSAMAGWHFNGNTQRSVTLQWLLPSAERSQA